MDLKFNKNISINVSVKKYLGWETLSFDKGNIFFKGERDSVIKIFEKFKKYKYDLRIIKKLLYNLNNCSSAIFFNHKYYICFTDFCRSNPIFLKHEPNHILISNTSEIFKKKN